MLKFKNLHVNSYENTQIIQVVNNYRNDLQKHRSHFNDQVIPDSAGMSENESRLNTFSGLNTGNLNKVENNFSYSADKELSTKNPSSIKNKKISRIIFKQNAAKRRESSNVVGASYSLNASPARKVSSIQIGRNRMNSVDKLRELEHSRDNNSESINRRKLSSSSIIFAKKSPLNNLGQHRYQQLGRHNGLSINTASSNSDGGKYVKSAVKMHRGIPNVSGV